MLQIRELAQEELAMLQAEVTAMQAELNATQAELAAMQAAQAFVTETVTEVVTATLARDLPALVRQHVEGLALEALGLPVTDTNGNVTETEPPSEAIPRPTSRRSKSSRSPLPQPEAPAQRVTATGNGGVTDTASQAQAPRRGGRPGVLRQPILDLLRKHPEGLTAVAIKVHLGTQKNIGDTLAGMVRNGLLEKQGRGKDVRYLAGAVPNTATREPSQPRPQARSKAGVR
jgi:hypothetical protein